MGEKKNLRRYAAVGITMGPYRSSGEPVPVKQKQRTRRRVTGTAVQSEYNPDGQVHINSRIPEKRSCWYASLAGRSFANETFLEVPRLRDGREIYWWVELRVKDHMRGPETSTFFLNLECATSTVTAERGRGYTFSIRHHRLYQLLHMTLVQALDVIPTCSDPSKILE